MPTIKQILADTSGTDLGTYIAGVVDDRLNPGTTHSHDLPAAFSWGKTPEGSDFWKAVKDGRYAYASAYIFSTLDGFLVCPHCGARSHYRMSIAPNGFDGVVVCQGAEGEGCNRVFCFTIDEAGKVERSEIF